MDGFRNAQARRVTALRSVTIRSRRTGIAVVTDWKEAGYPRAPGRGLGSSYLTQDGQVMVRINGMLLTFFDQAIRLAEGRASIQDLARESHASS
jgi:hypothetical protein